MTKLITTTNTKLTTTKGSKALQGFLTRAGTAVVSQTPIQPSERKPRVVFAMDATASRLPTWSEAKRVQGEMFKAMQGRGQVQLASFGGTSFRASRWASDAMELAEDMQAVDCEAGATQIVATLSHVSAEHRTTRVSALCFVGDAFEETEESAIAHAKRLGVLGVPCFMFQEGTNAQTERAYRAIAEASGGAYARFASQDSQEGLQALIGAVSAYAEGGRKALLRYGNQSNSQVVKAIASQLKLEGPAD